MAAELEIGASGVMTGAFLADGPTDTRLGFTRDLMRVGLGVRPELFSIAPLALRMSNFESLESQLVAVRMVAAARPGAVLLWLDGVDEDSREQRLFAALRLALLLKADGHRVLLGRAGDLRHLFLAFGIDGIEYGLGRFLRFAARDYAGKSGAGPTPMPRFESDAQMAAEDRRIPFENMVYIADGPSDVPVFSIVKQYGGQSLAVYEPGKPDKFAKASALSRQGRVDAVAEADYRPGKQAALWINEAVAKVAERMVEA